MHILDRIASKPLDTPDAEWKGSLVEAIACMGEEDVPAVVAVVIDQVGKLIGRATALERTTTVLTLNALRSRMEKNLGNALSGAVRDLQRPEDAVSH